MKTFDDIIAANDRIMSYLGNRYLEDLWPINSQLTSVLELLSDDESKDTYCREILMCIFHNFLRGELPYQLAGVMTQRQFNDYKLEAKEKNLCPELTDLANNNHIEDYFRATTFLLGQYKYKDKVNIKEKDICLDLGACLGDTSVWMLRSGAQATYAFEIDRANIEYIGKMKQKDPLFNNINVVNRAAADKKGAMWYTPGKNNNIGSGKVSQAKPADETAYEVQCTTIDDFCDENNIRPDFIKMDIEGAEPLAIAGARNTFLNHRPRFAISIYHSWNQRWRIPLQIAELCPDYDFYVKKSNPYYETVFMGAPRAKSA